MFQCVTWILAFSGIQPRSSPCRRAGRRILFSSVLWGHCQDALPPFRREGEDSLLLPSAGSGATPFPNILPTPLQIIPLLSFPQIRGHHLLPARMLTDAEHGKGTEVDKGAQGWMRQGEEKEMRKQNIVIIYLAFIRYLDHC